jgi:hypothetical protein
VAGRAWPEEEYKTMKFTGKLLEGDKVVLEAVQGNVDCATDQPGIIWFGWFEVNPKTWLDTRTKYRLELDDGRSGEILLTRVMPPETPKQVAEFKTEALQ